MFKRLKQDTATGSARKRLIERSTKVSQLSTYTIAVAISPCVSDFISLLRREKCNAPWRGRNKNLQSSFSQQLRKREKDDRGFATARSWSPWTAAFKAPIKKDSIKKHTHNKNMEFAHNFLTIIISDFLFF